jgi:hypothetical protein
MGRRRRSVNIFSAKGQLHCVRLFLIPNAAKVKLGTRKTPNARILHILFIHPTIIAAERGARCILLLLPP